MRRTTTCGPACCHAACAWPIYKSPSFLCPVYVWFCSVDVFRLLMCVFYTLRMASIEKSRFVCPVSACYFCVCLMCLICLCVFLLLYLYYMYLYGPACCGAACAWPMYTNPSVLCPIDVPVVCLLRGFNIHMANTEKSLFMWLFW